jgi:hypothetical protein
MYAGTDICPDGEVTVERAAIFAWLAPGPVVGIGAATQKGPGPPENP